MGYITTEGMAKIVHNQSKDGIEIYFPSKPNVAILENIKANGFRWGKFNKCWYARVSNRSIETAAKYGSLPSTLSPEAIEAQHEADGARGYVQAQEEAATLIGTAASSPLIQQVKKKENATFKLGVKGKEGGSFPGTTYYPVICKEKSLVSRARLLVTKGTMVAVEVTGNYDNLIVSTMLIMK